MKRRRRRFRVREKMLPIWDTVSVTTEFQSSESQSEKSFATTDLCAVLKAAEAVQVALAATVPELPAYSCVSVVTVASLFATAWSGFMFQNAELSWVRTAYASRVTLADVTDVVGGARSVDAARRHHSADHVRLAMRAVTLVAWTSYLAVRHGGEVVLVAANSGVVKRQTTVLERIVVETRQQRVPNAQHQLLITRRIFLLATHSRSDVLAKMAIVIVGTWLIVALDHSTARRSKRKLTSEADAGDWHALLLAQLLCEEVVFVSSSAFVSEGIAVAFYGIVVESIQRIFAFTFTPR